MTPILLLVFNRPQKTKEVLEALTAISYQRLYIACDGPRNEYDLRNIDEIKSLINSLVPSDVELHTSFSKHNLGCKKGVLRGINWFFENESEGIILEDDCVPTALFYDYADKSLNHYRSNKSIFHVSGTRFVSSSEKDVSLGDYPLMWGWATWRDKWKYYDDSDSKYQRAIVDKWLAQGIIRTIYWLCVASSVYSGKVDTWDIQWMISMWKNKGKAVRPPFNLVKNIGFDEDATHTKKEIGSLSIDKIGEIHYPDIPLFSKDLNKEDERIWAGISIKSVLVLIKNRLFVLD